MPRVAETREYRPAPVTGLSGVRAFCVQEAARFLLALPVRGLGRPESVECGYGGAAGVKEKGRLVHTAARAPIRVDIRYLDCFRFSVLHVRDNSGDGLRLSLDHVEQ